MPGLIRYRDDESFNRMLATTIELAKIENSDVKLKESAALQHLEHTILNRKAYSTGRDSSSVSRGHKFYYIVLQTLGYTDIELEKPLVDGLFVSDMYIPSIDMAIDVHGPVHYVNRSP